MEFLSKLSVVELPLDGDPDADGVEVPFSLSKRPTRRGRGGDKRAKKELEAAEAAEAAEAVRQLAESSAEPASRVSWADSEDIVRSEN